MSAFRSSEIERKTPPASKFKYNLTGVSVQFLSLKIPLVAPRTKEERKGRFDFVLFLYDPLHKLFLSNSNTELRCTKWLRMHWRHPILFFPGITKSSIQKNGNLILTQLVVLEKISNNYTLSTVANLQANNQEVVWFLYFNFLISTKCKLCEYVCVVMKSHVFSCLKKYCSNVTSVLFYFVFMLPKIVANNPKSSANQDSPVWWT